MTKLSPGFCFTLKNDTHPFKAFWLGAFLAPIMVDLPHMDNGVELMRLISEKYPDIVILQE
jgi:hypothetical protein